MNPADLISVYVPTNFAVDYDNSAHKLNLQNYGDYVTEVVADLDGYVDFELGSAEENQYFESCTEGSVTGRSSISKSVYMAHIEMTTTNLPL